MRVAIAGAGKVGQAIAEELLDQHHHVVLIEENPRIAADARRRLPRASFVEADACELHTLAPAELESVDAAIAATGEDQVNLVFSLLASQEFGVPRVVARVNDPRNTWLFTEAWGIDTAVSTPSLLASSALESVASGALIRLQSFQNGRVRFSSLIVQEEHPARDRAIRDLELPMGANVAAIIREGVVVPPDPDQIVGIGDELLLVLEAEVEEEVAEVLIGSAVVMGDVGDMPDREKDQRW